jgi:predicted RNase H-like nuclease (RuvC/YqgF family)
MDDDLIYANVIHTNKNSSPNNLDADSSANLTQSVYYDAAINNNRLTVEELDESKRNLSPDTDVEKVDDSSLIALKEQIKHLNEQLNAKVQENSDLNSCLMKQASLSENLSNLLRVSDEKNGQLETSYRSKIETLQNENGRIHILNNLLNFNFNN